MAYKNYGPCAGLIVNGTGSGPNDFSSIQAALNATYSPGMVSPGTVPVYLSSSIIEDITLSDGNAYYITSLNPNPINLLSSLITISNGSSLTIQNLKLITNNSGVINFSGATLNLINCTIINTSGVAFTFAGNGSVNFHNCSIENDDPTNACFTSTSSGTISIYDSTITNAGLKSTFSNGTLYVINSSFGGGATLTSNTTNYYHCVFPPFVSGITHITTVTAGTTSLFNCTLSSVSSSAISVGASTTVVLTNCSISSSTTNAITGAGTVKYGEIDFFGTSSTINTTTQTNLVSKIGTLTAHGVVTGAGLVSSADPGGTASSNTLSSVSSTTISTGVGTVHMSSANPATNAAWIKVYAGTTAYFIPCWTTNSP